jgi:4-amino-4-deoxy-L-arabinose transferase-like glycosyltransferase
MSRGRKQTATPRQREGLLDFFPKFESNELKFLALIIGTGVLLRLVYLFEFHGSIFYHRYVLDSQVIDLWAKDIASGNFLGDRAFFRAPFYVYTVALLYRFFGTSPLPVILLQNLLGVATVYLLFIYTRHLFGTRIAVIAAAITACHPTLIFFEGELMITSMEVFFAILCLIVMHRAWQLRTTRSALVAGAVLGLAAITRPTFLVIMLVLPIQFLALRSSIPLRQAARTVAIFLLGMLLPIIPVTARNAIVADDFVLISSQGGSNFYVGNGSRADGITVRALGPITNMGPYQDNIWSSSVGVAQQQLGRSLKESEVSSYWTDQALSEMAADPGRAIGLMLKKFYYFWHGQEIINDKSVYLCREYSALMSVLLWKQLLNFPSGVLFPLMVVGIWASWHRRKELLQPLSILLLYSLAITLFFVCSRFRQPILPIAIMFAAAGAVRLIDDFKNKRAKVLLGSGGLLLIGVLVMNWGGDVDSAINRSQYEWMLGDRYLSEKNYDKGIAHLNKALTNSPNHLGVLGQLGAAYSDVGRLEDAERVLKQGLSLYPNYPLFHYNLGIVYSKRNQVEESKTCFRQAIGEDSTFAMPYLRLGEIFEYESLPDSARIVYETLLRFQPDNSEALQKLQKFR